MTYEEAKELKDAGYPQTIYLYEETREHGNAPALPELIEACGEKFMKLSRWEDDKGVFWKAAGRVSNKQTTYLQGDTPEQAVINLWLALNKK